MPGGTQEALWYERGWGDTHQTAPRNAAIAAAHLLRCSIRDAAIRLQAECIEGCQLLPLGHLRFCGWGGQHLVIAALDSCRQHRLRGEKGGLAWRVVVNPSDPSCNCAAAVLVCIQTRRPCPTWSLVWIHTVRLAAAEQVTHTRALAVPVRLGGRGDPLQAR